MRRSVASAGPVTVRRMGRKASKPVSSPRRCTRDDKQNALRQPRTGVPALTGPAPTPARLGGPAAWYALLLIVIVQAMSLLDRQVLAILVPRIRADLGVGAAEMGLLYGTVFALFYAIFSLPLGRLADGWVRTKLLSLSILGWSVMTAMAGFANGIGLLAVSRLGVGVGEASAQPAGMSLLADSFSKKWRGMVAGAMSIAVALGLGAALWIGGTVAHGWGAHWPGGIGAPLSLQGGEAAVILAALPRPPPAFLLWGGPRAGRGGPRRLP